MKKLLILGAVGVAGFVGLQVFPAQKLGIHTEDIGTNPTARFELDAPPEVAAIMKRACFDCHSNETKWPLYTRIAPGSWLMARDVHAGRNHINFSNWGEADEEERTSDKKSSWEQIESGEMPPWFYVYPFHLSSKLSEADKAKLKEWLLKEPEKKDAPAEAAQDQVAEGENAKAKAEDGASPDAKSEKPVAVAKADKAEAKADLKKPDKHKKHAHGK